MNKRIMCFILVFIFSINILMVQAEGSAEKNNLSLSKTEDVKKFCDDNITMLLKKYHIAGATVSVVKDGKIIYKGGYGFYNKDRQKTVSADETLFRIGSVTKLFTWTAVMQLTEQGKIDLDEDINHYLKDFKIPDAYGKPITMKHLMTHTSGFEDSLKDLFQDPKVKVRPLLDTLKENIPNRIYAPGEIIAYSNYGAALAGLIVEQVSGEKYNAYIEKNILKPLEMNQTFISHEETDDHTSLGFRYKNGEYEGSKDATIQLVPTGSISSTAEDMAHFMIAHLQNGSFKDKEILSKEAAVNMHSQQFTNDKELPGMCLGFMEWNRNGQRIIWHSGGSALFRTLLMLIPNENTGLFISFNSPDADAARSELRQAFLDTFYPHQEKTFKPLANYKERVNKFEGIYQEARQAKFTSEKIVFALSRSKKAEANEDGTLSFRDTKWIEVKPYVFKEVGGQGILKFRHDDKGNITHAFQDFEPHEAYFKAPFYMEPLIIIMPLMISLLCLIYVLIILPLIKKLGKIQDSKFAGSRFLKAMCLLNISYILLIAIDIVKIIYSGNFEMKLGELYQFLNTIKGVAFAAAILNAITLFYAIDIWKHKTGKIFFRISYTTGTVGGCLFIIWLKFWNFI